MAYWDNVKGKGKTGNDKPPITLCDGVNRNGTIFNLKPSEAWDSQNMSNRNYDCLSVRLGRTAYAEAITTPNGAGVYNNTYAHVLDGTTWKRWDGTVWQTVAASLANAQARLVEFNTEAKRYMVMVDGTNKKSWDGTNVADLTEAPATNLVTVDDYRLYALIGSVLKCSAEGTIANWSTSTYANDADSFPITSMVGVGTAITTWSDTVICWSEQNMHIVYGNDPYDFYLSDPLDHGCISDRSVVKLNGVYFLDYGQYKKYVTGDAVDISQKVKYWLENINLTYKAKCVAGADKRYIYLSIPFGSTATANNITLVYDTKLENWDIWNEGYSNFINIGESVYGISPTGTLYKLNDGLTNAGTAISWYHVTGMMFKGFNKQSLSSIPVLVNMPVGSTFKVAYNTNINTPSFTDIYTFTASANVQSKIVNIPTNVLNDIDYYQLKFYGTGQVDIYYIGLDDRIKPR